MLGCVHTERDNVFLCRGTSEAVVAPTLKFLWLGVHTDGSISGDSTPLLPPISIFDTSLLPADLKRQDMSCSRKSEKFNGHLPGDVRA